MELYGIHTVLIDLMLIQLFLVGNLGLPAAAIEPVPEGSVSTVEERTLEDRERWWKMGLKAISDGKLAVLLLSGGQVLSSVFVYQFSKYALTLLDGLFCCLV